MPERDLNYFRDLLLKQRREIFDRLNQFKTQWHSLGEREIELEEESQKLDITSLYNKLDALETEQIEAIDLALYRMALSDYGTCESCRRPITLKRLETLPYARLCVRCARYYEERQKRLPRAREQIRSGELPDEFKNMTDEELQEAIHEQLKSDGRVDMDELSITCKKGVLYLEGVVPTEEEHHIVMRTLREMMGFTAIIDYLDADQVIWETERFASGRSDFPPHIDVDDISEDVFESQEEETPYMFPDHPPPEEE